MTDERLAFLERQGGEHGIMIGDLRRSIEKLERRVDSLDERMVRGFERVDQQLIALDQKIDRRVDVLDAKMSRLFVWMVGLQVTTFVSLASLILSR